MERDGLTGWADPEDPDTWFLPPLNRYGGVETNHRIFAGFPDEPGDNGTFLDHQYFYDARQFRDLAGGKWKVFRKNVRKYPRQFPDEGNGNVRLVYRELWPAERHEEVAELLMMWAEGKTLQDPETLAAFVISGAFRWGLFLDGRLVGINVGDLNYSGAIYRYCVDNGTPYLNEYLRHLFFLSDWVQERRWVNDGGDLGSPGLAAFKRRLNPAMICAVYSHSEEGR